MAAPFLHLGCFCLDLYYRVELNSVVSSLFFQAIITYMSIIRESYKG